MTPSQLEHLKLIDAHLGRLLAIAEKRTPGEWTVHNQTFVEQNGDIIAYCLLEETRSFVMKRDGVNNAAFIASCAGNAEAGWRATRAAIKSLLEIDKFLNSVSKSDFTVRTAALIQDALTPHILAAFPLELIQKP